MVRVYVSFDSGAWKTLCTVPQELVRPESCLYIWTRLKWWKWQVSTAIQLWFARILGKWEDWKWSGFWIWYLGKASYSQDRVTCKVDRTLFLRRVFAVFSKVAVWAMYFGQCISSLCHKMSQGSKNVAFATMIAESTGVRQTFECSCNSTPHNFSSGSVYTVYNAWLTRPTQALGFNFVSSMCFDFFRMWK